MDGMSDLAIVLGHLLLGGLFVFAGFDHFLRFEVVSGMLAQRGWTRPRPMLAVASVFQVVAGLGLALGVLRPWAALGLAAFTIAASLTLLDFWRFRGPQREGMRSGFLVNVGLLGGLILAFGESL
jgi:putative oxidoreductase